MRGCFDSSGLEDPAQDAGVEYWSVGEYPSFLLDILWGVRRDGTDFRHFSSRWKDEVWTSHSKRDPPEVTVTWEGGRTYGMPTPKKLRVVNKNNAHVAAGTIAGDMVEVAPPPLL